MYANTHLIAKEISKSWKALGPEGKKPWKARSVELERELLLKHPEYRFDPRKPSEIPRRNKSEKLLPPNVELGNPIPEPSVPDNVAQIDDFNAYGVDDHSIVVAQDPAGFEDNINAYGADDHPIVDEQNLIVFDDNARGEDNYSIVDEQNLTAFNDNAYGENNHFIPNEQNFTAFDDAYGVGNYSNVDAQNHQGFDNGNGEELFGMPGGLYDSQY